MHWTQKPENREKLMAIQRKAVAGKLRSLRKQKKTKIMPQEQKKAISLGRNYEIERKATVRRQAVVLLMDEISERAAWKILKEILLG